MENAKLSKIFLAGILFFLVVFGLVAFRLYRHVYPIIHYAPTVKVVLREGLTNDEMANILAKTLPSFDKNTFIEKTKDRQGYLFPDTYFFSTSATADTVIGMLHMNFNKKIAPLESDITESGRSLLQIITMASLVEKEASGTSDASVIAGILWRRISLGMPLQVDAAPETYKVKGLPHAPIANPGLVSIEASLHPSESSYLYYLHDKNGMVHYATTFAEHRANIAKYLK